MRSVSAVGTMLGITLWTGLGIWFSWVQPGSVWTPGRTLVALWLVSGGVVSAVLLLRDGHSNRALLGTALIVNICLIALGFGVLRNRPWFEAALNPPRRLAGFEIKFDNSPLALASDAWHEDVSVRPADRGSSGPAPGPPPDEHCALVTAAVSATNHSEWLFFRGSPDDLTSCLSGQTPSRRRSGPSRTVTLARRELVANSESIAVEVLSDDPDDSQLRLLGGTERTVFVADYGASCLRICVVGGVCSSEASAVPMGEARFFRLEGTENVVVASSNHWWSFESNQLLSQGQARGDTLSVVADGRLLQLNASRHLFTIDVRTGHHVESTVAHVRLDTSGTVARNATGHVAFLREDGLLVIDGAPISDLHFDRIASDGNAFVGYHSLAEVPTDDLFLQGFQPATYEAKFVRWRDGGTTNLGRRRGMSRELRDFR